MSAWQGLLNFNFVKVYICPKGMSFIESFLAMVLGKLVLYAMRSAQRRTNGDMF